jgi:predicted dehydrogenase
VLCEKPLASTADDAESMWEAARRSGRVHMVAFNYRRTPAVALAKKYIDEGVSIVGVASGFPRYSSADVRQVRLDVRADGATRGPY